MIFGIFYMKVSFVPFFVLLFFWNFFFLCDLKSKSVIIYQIKENESHVINQGIILIQISFVLAFLYDIN